MQVTSLGTVSETMTADPSVPGTGPRRTQRRRGDVIAGLESGERLGGSLGDLEEGIELGELEEGAEVVVQSGQPQLAAELPDLPRDGDECAEARGIDVAGVGEIEEELPVAGGEGALDEVLELVTIADDELPVVSYHEYAVRLPALRERHQLAPGVAVGSVCRATIAATSTISSTPAPRDKSAIGRASPCRMGPSATAPASRCTSL